LANLYIGLVHYPIMNKHKEVITTAITNYDIHDIARASITYDVSKYFVIHNIPAQRELAANIGNLVLVVPIIQIEKMLSQALNSLILSLWQCVLSRN
jgi:hypothetical protein